MTRILTAGKADTDVGFELLFKDAPDEFSDRCVTLSDSSLPFPDFATGDFVVPSLGQFEMGDRQLVGILDSFGKLQRFRIEGSKVCATYRIMATGFYNESKKAGTVGPGILFYETIPKRECPMIHPMCNVEAPSDNNFVNTFKLQDKILSISDTHTMLEVDPVSLEVEGIHRFDDKVEEAIPFGSSAHPKIHPSTGDIIDFIGNGNPMLNSAKVSLYALNESAPHERKVFRDIHYDSAPYMHSFGVSEKHLVLPRMPLKFDLAKVIMDPLSAAFTPINPSSEKHSNGFTIVPLSGDAPFYRDLPNDHPLYFVHTVNTYETDTDIIMDLTTDKTNPFLGEEMKLPANRNKTQRDAFSRGGVTRFTIPLDATKPILSEGVSIPTAMTDFPTINPRMDGKKYCFYWAVTWFADEKSYASMALVKHDVCSGDPTKPVGRWLRENWYVSEATFIASSKPGAMEDDGLLLFVALDGEHDQSYLMGMDAKTMELKSQAGPFPRIAFTTHGQFYGRGTWKSAQDVQALIV